MSSAAAAGAGGDVDEELLGMVRAFLGTKSPDELSDMAEDDTDMALAIEGQYGILGAIGIGLARRQLGDERITAIRGYGEDQFDQVLAEIGISHPDHAAILGANYGGYLSQMERVKRRLTG